jgi:hypothetical protein
MPTKQQAKKTYKTANGKQIDLDLLIARNELTPAVSNVRVNARGDELGQGGKIVRKREDLMKDYYNQSKRMADETVIKPQTPDPIEDEWEENATGDFVEKPKATRQSSGKTDV